MNGVQSVMALVRTRLKRTGCEVGGILRGPGAQASVTYLLGTDLGKNCSYSQWSLLTQTLGYIEKMKHLVLIMFIEFTPPV